MPKGILRVITLLSLFFLLTNPVYAQEADETAKTEVSQPETEKPAIEAEATKKEESPNSKEAEKKKDILETINGVLATCLFFDVTGGAIEVDNIDRDGKPLDPKTPKKKVEVPFIVVFLALGAIFFTFFYRFIN